MRLTFDGQKFVLLCGFGEDQQAIDAGFNWSGQNWWSGQAALAAKFEPCADARAQEMLRRYKQKVLLSRASDIDGFNPPCPKDLAYLPFQKVGGYYALQRHTTLIADEMGLGKSVEDILINNVDERLTSLLYILPADLMINWGRELKKWLVRNLSIDAVEGKYFPKSDVVLISYDMVMTHREAILSREWHKITRDESHYIKNPETKRTLAILGGEVKEGRKVIDVLQPIKATYFDLFLTGTPILNRPVELWPVVQFGDPSGLGANYYSYTKRYCGAWKAPWGMDVSRATNLDELNNRLRSSIMVRRLKKDVLTELPPKRRQLVTIPGDAIRKVLSQELDFYQRYNSVINEIQTKVEKEYQLADSDEEEAYSDAVKKLMPGSKAELWEEMSRLRHQTALAKVPFMITWLEYVLEQQDKVANYLHHRDVMLLLQQHFKDKCVLHHGGMSKTQKQDSVDRFQSRPDIKVWLGSITTAKGYTVTASSYGMIGELDWRPGIVSQAEDRHHRIGQKGWVLIQHLVFDNSFDAIMAQKIVEKQEIIDKALN